MQMDIDWTQILSYVLGVVGAWVLGQPLVMKLIAKVKGWLPSPTSTNLSTILTSEESAGNIEEFADDAETDTAADLLHAAFVFKDLDNQAGVDRCLEAIRELTKTNKTNKAEAAQ